MTRSRRRRREGSGYGEGGSMYERGRERAGGISQWQAWQRRRQRKIRSTDFTPPTLVIIIIFFYYFLLPRPFLSFPVHNPLASSKALFNGSSPRAFPSPLPLPSFAPIVVGIQIHGGFWSDSSALVGVDFDE